MIDPHRLAERGEVRKGRFPLAQMARLSDALRDTSGDASYECRFSMNAVHGVAVAAGVVESELHLLCQRCMKPMRLPVRHTLNVAFVESDREAEDVGDDFDPVIVEDQIVSIRDLVEDELILALPLVPMHESCDGGDNNIEGQPPAPEEGVRENPFQVLEKLKR